MNEGPSRPREIRPSHILTVGAVIILVFTFLGYLGQTRSHRHARTANPEDETVTQRVVYATKFCVDYQANVIAADQEYKGALVTLEGLVSRIGRDHLPDDRSRGAATLDLWSGLVDCGEYDSLSAECFMQEGQDEAVVQMHKCQEVSVRGVCVGQENGKPRLVDCVIVERTQP